MAYGIAYIPVTKNNGVTLQLSERKKVVSLPRSFYKGLIIT